MVLVRSPNTNLEAANARKASTEATNDAQKATKFRSRRSRRSRRKVKRLESTYVKDTEKRSEINMKLP